MATRKIVILERVNEPSDYDFKYILRATYNAKFNDLKKDPNRVSILKDATQEEKDEMVLGLVEERSGVANYTPGTTIDQIKADLEDRLAKFQSELDNRNPFKLFNTSFDGSVWTEEGVQ